MKLSSSYKKKWIFIIFIVAVLSASVLILSIMLISITNTAESLAKSLILRTTANSKIELDKYFETMITNLRIGKELCEQGVFDAENYKKTDAYILPVLNNINAINTFLIADTLGNEYSIIREDSTWLVNVVSESIDSGMIIKRFRRKNIYEKQKYNEKWIEYNSTWDPRKRPWFIGAMTTTKPKIVWWTEPYILYTPQMPGITMSLRSFCEKTKKYHVIQYDILLSHISEFTTNTKISKNGKTFVLSNKYDVIGLPKEKFLTNLDSIKKYILNPYDSVRSDDMKIAINKWKKISKDKNKPFSFYKNGEKWWAKISEYKLGINNNFIIGVIVPENDFVEEVHKTRNVIFAGFAIVFVFIILVIRQNNIRRKINIILTEQKKQITDSIVYAERIQRALLPSKEYLDEIFNEYFILLKPLHIVSGDFYWIKKIENQIVIAVADCTGHGVPGAFMSMLGISFLNEIINKEKITQANHILNELRQYVKTSLKQTGKEEDAKDGMDMALYTINTKNLKMQFAGAYNPLFIIRNNKLITLKADRQPIAIHIKEKDFTNIDFQLQKNDVLYSFSDGFVDQFGGMQGKKFMIKNFKKLLLDIHKEPFDKQKIILNDILIKWIKGYEQLDDILIVGIKINTSLNFETYKEYKNI